MTPGSRGRFPGRAAFVAVVAASLAGCGGRDAPVPTFGAAEGGPSVLLSGSVPEAGSYSGVGRFRGGATCTAVFIRPSGDDPPGDAPAYVLTNGHCVGFLAANEVILGGETGATVTFAFFHDATDRQVRVAARRVAHATMKGQDLAVVELGVGYRELVDQGIRPWGLAGYVPAPGLNEPVVVVGAPLQSDPSLSFLRLAACRAGGRAPVVLERQWHWFDLDRNGCADIAGGSSGSPVLSRDTGKVVGIINTSTLGSEGLADCALNRPCEADDAGARSRESTSYSVPVTGLGRCFGDDGRFDVGRSGCPLDDGRQIEADPGWLSAKNPDLPPRRPGRPNDRWAVSVAGSPFAYYRHKIGPAGTIDCRNASGYGGPMELTATSRVDDPLPAGEGDYFLCLLGSETPAGDSGQDPRTPTVVAVRIDKTPPRIEPILEVRESDDHWTVSWGYAPPEISAYSWKYGPLAETDCGEPSGYRSVGFGFVNLAKSEAPWRFCAIAYDDADNATPPAEIVLK